jgi:hypothetical protein
MFHFVQNIPKTLLTPTKHLIFLEKKKQTEPDYPARWRQPISLARLLI